MSSNVLRQGFSEVLQDPSLLLIEIGWRWTFGAISILVVSASAFLLLKSIAFDPHQLESLTALSAWQLAQTLASSVATGTAVLFRLVAVSSFVLAVCWTVLSAVGRYATLARPALAPGASLRTCFAISSARALVTLAAILAWITTGFLVGMIGAASSARRDLPVSAVSLAILLPVLVLIVGLWSLSNWYLSFAPLFPESRWTQLIAEGWKFVRSGRDQVLEVSMATGILRAGLFVVALLLSVAAGAVITNPRVLLANLVVISLLYFLIADFIYVARLAAYAKLRMGLIAQRLLTEGSEAPKAHAGPPVPLQSACEDA
jgi:hypothetical protein